MVRIIDELEKIAEWSRDKRDCYGCYQTVMGLADSMKRVPSGLLNFIVFMIFVLIFVGIVYGIGVFEEGPPSIKSVTGLSETGSPQTGSTDIGAAGKNGGNVVGEEEKNQLEELPECTPKDDINKFKDLAKKYTDRIRTAIKKGGTYTVRRSKIVLGCISYPGKKLIDVCYKNKVNIPICAAGITIANDWGIAYTFTDIKEEPGEKPAMDSKKSGDNNQETVPDNTVGEIGGEDKLVKPIRKLMVPISKQEDIKNIGRKACIKNGTDKSDLLGIDLGDITFVGKKEFGFEYEWKNNKGGKTKCTYVENKGTLIG